jgi:flagellar hook-basal body complex protein FliE
MIQNVSHMRTAKVADPFEQFSVEFGDRLTQTSPVAPMSPEGPNFGELVKDALAEVGRLEEDAAQKTFDFATGKPVDIHQMMIASAKADVTLQLTSAVISKTSQGINTLMQTQV